MTVDRASLLRLVMASGDDASRVVFADWLEEHGESARAQLIQLQCEAVRGSPWDGRATEIGWEVDWLLFAHDAALRADLPALEGVTWLAFERGFVSAIRVRGAGPLLDHATEIAAIAPVSTVELAPAPAVPLWQHSSFEERIAARRASPLEPRPEPIVLPPWVRKLRVTSHDAATGFARDTVRPLFAQLESLELVQVGSNGLEWLQLPDDAKLTELVLAPDNTEVGLEFVRRVSGTRWGKRLATLVMPSKWVYVDDGYGGADPDPRLGAEGGRLLARLDRLERLVIDRQRIATKALQELFAKLPRLVELSARECSIAKLTTLAGHGEALRRLVLANNKLGNDGATAIARAPRLAKLECLDLDTCEIEGYGVLELVKSPAWQTLRELNLSRNPLGVGGMRAFAEAAAPQHLATLKLADTDLDQSAGLALGKIGWLANLVALDLSGNRLAAGASGLRNFAPDKLRSLTLAAAGLERSEAAILARFWPQLVVLDAGHNALGDQGIERFAVVKPAAHLQSLALYDCNLTDDGLELLARARCPRLRQLRLDGNKLGAHGLTMLLSSPVVQHLEVLDLSRCELDAKAVAAIASMPHLSRLSRLVLRGNDLDEESLVRLADSATLTHVKQFDLEGLPWTYPEAVRARLDARFGDGWYRRDDDA